LGDLTTKDSKDAKDRLTQINTDFVLAVLWPDNLIPQTMG
jgi:hypothetical protein